MTPKKIWISIIGTGVIASVTTAAAYFPEYKVILISASTLVAAVMAFLTGSDNTKV